MAEKIRKGIVICDVMYSSKIKKKLRYNTPVTEAMLHDFDEHIRLGNIKEIKEDPEKIKVAKLESKPKVDSKAGK